MHNSSLIKERISSQRLRIARKTEKLFKRTLVAVVCLPLLAALIIHGGIITFTVLVTIAIMLGIMELYNIVAPNTRNWNLTRVSVLIIGAVLPLGILYRGITSDSFYPLIISVLFFISAVQLLRKSSGGLHNLTLTFLSFLYVSWLLSHLIMLRILNPYFVISILFITWTGDAAAYLVGSLYGKHKLIPRISPQKSWEGAIGTILCSLIAVFFVRRFFLEGVISLTTTDCVVLGLLLGGMNILGDLVESAIKRKSHAKHSGNLVPGHGGILDVADSLLFTAPAMYYYLQIFKL